MTESTPLALLFLSSLDETDPTGDTDIIRLEKTLCSIVDAAEAQWPKLTLTPGVYLPYLVEKLPESNDLVQGLSQLQTTDLYLACGCAVKAEPALQLFEQHFGDKIELCLAQYRASQALIQDVHQLLRQKLFVAESNAGGDIVKYSGRGTLASWVRVTATHLALRLLRNEKREIPDEEKLLHVISTKSVDPELDYLKHYYKEQFKQAFRQAMATLDRRDRNLLRHRILDGMSIDDIGSLYKVHRATASRWLVKIRKALSDKTRDLMTRDLEISDYEYESIVRIIRTQLDLSISQYLAAESLDSNHQTVKTYLSA